MNKAPPDMSCLSRCAQNFGGQKICLSEAVYYSPPVGMVLITSSSIGVLLMKLSLDWQQPGETVYSLRQLAFLNLMFSYHLFSKKLLNNFCMFSTTVL